MKESGVAMGLKALASKLHPQLPLSPKESQRLLTALTTSFREHLDQAHPKTAEDKLPKLTQTSATALSRKNNKSVRSSAAYADQHMANVLTMFGHGNPSPPGPSPSIAVRKELDSGADPLALLEDYEKKGLANVEIADMCLKHFRNAFTSKSYTEQAEIVQENHAGTRALAWLWKSGRHESAEFVENRTFMFSLARLLMLQRQEQFLWDWLQLDIGERAKPLTDYVPGHQERFNARWKVRLIQCMIQAAVATPRKAHASLDHTLKIFLKAADMKAAATASGGSFQHVRVLLTLSDIVRTLSFPGIDMSSTSPVLMSKMLGYIARKKSNPQVDYYLAALELLSPIEPNPGKALAYLQRGFAPEKSEFTDSFKKYFLSRAGKSRQKLMAATAGSLHADGDFENASWVGQKLLADESLNCNESQILTRMWEKHFAGKKAQALLDNAPRERPADPPVSFQYAPTAV